MELDDFSKLLPDMLIEARKVPYGGYQSIEEAAIDIMLFAWEAGISPERLEQELIILEGAQNAFSLEKLSHLAGIAAFALSAYQQFGAEAKEADPAPTPPAAVAAIEAAKQGGAAGSGRTLTAEEAQVYFDRHRMRASGQLPIRPTPLKPGRYADEATRDS